MGFLGCASFRFSVFSVRLGDILELTKAFNMKETKELAEVAGCNHSSEVSSPVAGNFPGYMDYQVGMRSQIPVERKWALGIQAMQLLQLQLSSLHQSKWRKRRRSYFRSKCYKWKRRSCFSCSCLQSKCCQGRDNFGNCCILPKFCTCSYPSCPSFLFGAKIDSNEYIWWKANARETKEELIDREPKFLD
ncbi:hypothetical protein Ahy_B03g065116 [Arachis hypogaea]|uniref:Uncharacterized protein n=1 Tax=Arachis hypogaea TaxID=3818 RepID=A0A445A0W9_ARAHY|nr:hypothetical protein Ahy_B03g065116 [Arachis hypogaea]